MESSHSSSDSGEGGSSAGLDEQHSCYTCRIPGCETPIDHARHGCPSFSHGGRCFRHCYAGGMDETCTCSGI